MSALFRCMAFCVLTLLFGAPLGAVPVLRQDRPASEWLLGLGDSQAVKRQAAHAWLVRNLGPEHWLDVVDAAGSSNYSTRRGLARVLSDHPRHFSIAARLTALKGPALAEVGDWALRESALAWNTNLAEASLGVAEFPSVWLEEGGRQDLLEVNPKSPKPGGLAVALHRLNQCGAAPVPLVLDPRLDSRRRMLPSLKKGLEPLQGSWELLLVSLVREHKVTLEVVGWRPKSVDRSDVATAGSPGAFVRVKAREDASSDRGAQLLARWVRGAAQDSDLVRRISCANALAQVGWPTALAWLGQRWSQGEADYFEAVCLGAANGFLTPALLYPRGVQLLLEQGSSGRETWGARAWDRTFLAARALRELPGVLSDGMTLGDVFLQDWPKDNPRGQWLRYSAFSGRFLPHPGFASQALIGIRSQAAPAVRRSALAALVSAGGKEIGQIERIAEMQAGLNPAAVEAWVRDLELLGARPAADSDFQALRAQESLAGRFAFWWFLVGAHKHAEAVGKELAGSARGLDSLALSLGEPLARGRRAEVLAWVESITQFDPGRGRTLALRLSLIDDPAAFEYLEKILKKSEFEAQDLMDLAYLSTLKNVGARARGALIGMLEKQPAPAGLGAALEQAQFNLQSSGAHLQAEMFGEDLRRKAVRSSHALTDRILEDSWARQSPTKPGSRGRVPLGSFEMSPPR